LNGYVLSLVFCDGVADCSMELFSCPRSRERGLRTTQGQFSEV
jgi:hypothetical protein